MKKIGACRLAWIFAGSILGAGLVSGQELLQFFGRFGIWGGIGLVLSVFLLMLLGIIVMSIAAERKTSEMDKIIFSGNSRLLSGIIGVLQIIFLLGLITVMTAGTGELMNQLTGIPAWAACIVMTIIISLIALAGLDGVSSVFSVCVPLIAVAAVIFAVISVFCFHGDGMFEFHDNKFLPNWIVSSVIYTSYNIFASLGVLTPCGVKIENRKTLYKGAMLGAAILLIISGCIFAAIAKYPEAAKSGLPMLSLANAISPVLGYIYGLLLLCGLLGTSISSLVAADTYMSAKFKFLSKHRGLFIIAAAALTFTASLFGFGNLIGTVYPVFGYVNIIFIVFMIINFVKCSNTETFSSERP